MNGIFDQMTQQAAAVLATTTRKITRCAQNTSALARLSRAVASCPVGPVFTGPPLFSEHALHALVSCPDRPAHTRKDGLGTLVDFLGTPARFGMVQSDCRISLITQLSRSNSRVTATQTPPPGHETMLVAEMRMRISMCHMI